MPIPIKRKHILAAAALLLLPFGCATLTQSGSQKIVFRAKNVDGVSCRITTDDGEKWVLSSLPAAIIVERKQRPIHGTCKKAGYKRYKFTLEPRFEGKPTENLLLGLGVTPMFVAFDVFMGHHWHFPASVEMYIEPTRLSAKERLKWLREMKPEEAILHCQRMECPPELIARLMEPEPTVPVVVPPPKPEAEEKPSVTIQEEATAALLLTGTGGAVTLVAGVTPTGWATPTGGAASITGGESAPALPRAEVRQEPEGIPSPRLAVHPGFPETGKGDYLILAGAYLKREQVKRIFTLLMENGIPAYLYEPDESSSPFTHIRIGPFATQTDAERAVTIIREKVVVELEMVPVNK